MSSNDSNQLEVVTWLCLFWNFLQAEHEALGSSSDRFSHVYVLCRNNTSEHCEALWDIQNLFVGQFQFGRPRPSWQPAHPRWTWNQKVVTASSWNARVKNPMTETRKCSSGLLLLVSDILVLSKERHFVNLDSRMNWFRPLTSKTSLVHPVVANFTKKKKILLSIVEIFYQQDVRS